MEGFYRRQQNNNYRSSFHYRCYQSPPSNAFPEKISHRAQCWPYIPHIPWQTNGFRWNIKFTQKLEPSNPCSGILWTNFAFIFRKNKTRAVPYGTDTERTGKYWPWRIERWVKLRNPTTWNRSSEFWSGQVATKLEINWQKSLQKILSLTHCWMRQGRNFSTHFELA